jgi:hypothetical protein
MSEFSIPSNVLRWVAPSALVVAALSGCGSSSQSAGVAQVPQVAFDSARKTSKPTPLLFATDLDAAALYAYKLAGQNQSPLWTLSGSPLRYPAGLWVDGNLDLYVADESGYVYEYEAPTASGPPSGPSFTYDDPGEYPIAVAACGNYVYAANAIGESSAQSFTVWAKGTAQPLRVAKAADYLDGVGQGITCDATGAGHVYFAFDYDDNGPGGVDLWAADGSGTPTSLPMLPDYLEGLARNKAGVFVIGDAYASPSPAIQFFKATKTAPTHQITGSWVGRPVGFAYESSDQALWVADSSYATLTRIAPAKGAVLNTITKPGFSALEGVAVSPPDHP